MAIGITGGIGSGKSTIARELAQRGYAVYDCDREAKRIIVEDPTVRAAITDVFGAEAFEGKCYNTSYISRQVFAEPALLQQLNAIVHPAVKRDILLKQPHYVESAILFESGMDCLCNKIIIVDAPETIRIERTIGRDYRGVMSAENIEKVRARMRAQTPYIPQQDSQSILVVHNDGNTPIADIVDAIIAFSA